MDMPVLKPILIPTQGLPFFKRLWALITVVRKWEVSENWFYDLPNGKRIVIPKGFVFDGASIPKPLWGFLSPTGLLMVAGLIHDYSYRYAYLWAIDDTGNAYKYKYKKGTRQDYDELFKKVNIAVNGMVVVDTVATWMLKAFGHIAWNKHRKTYSPPIVPVLR